MPLFGDHDGEDEDAFVCATLQDTENVSNTTATNPTLILNDEWVVAVQMKLSNFSLKTVRVALL